MDVIVLVGLPNQGKTTTINLVWDMLTAQNGFSINRQPLGGDLNDFSDIVLWHNKRIAFFSMGDNSTALSKAVYDYYNQKYDKMVCALSINTPKVRANNTLNYFNATRINKTVAMSPNLESLVNAGDAQVIFNLL